MGVCVGGGVIGVGSQITGPANTLGKQGHIRSIVPWQPYKSKDASSSIIILPLTSYMYYCLGVLISVFQENHRLVTIKTLPWYKSVMSVKQLWIHLSQ